MAKQCKICGDIVSNSVGFMREHLELHHSGAVAFEPEEVQNQFSEVADSAKEQDAAEEIDRILRHLRAAGGDESNLDDLVMDAVSAIASDINNGGLEAQVKFLLEQGVSEQEILETVE
jgi:hypothetical protein